jgi:uncharacterized protein YbaA (DUF1428 family)
VSVEREDGLAWWFEYRPSDDWRAERFVEQWAREFEAGRVTGFTVVQHAGDETPRVSWTVPARRGPARGVACAP